MIPVHVGRSLGLLAVLTGNIAGLRPLFAAEPLREGDCLVLIGNTLIEREQRYSFLETCLAASQPAVRVTVRNLGWSGDTVFGDARAGFDTPREGFQRLVQHVAALRPSVLVVGYGGNEAFAGPQGLEPFRQGLQRLLDAVHRPSMRVILLTPPPHENLGPPLPDPAQHNARLRQYAQAIRDIAAQRSYACVDLFGMLEASFARPPHAGTTAAAPGSRSTWTDNGIHFHEEGYRRLAALLAPALGAQPPAWDVALTVEGQRITHRARGTKLSDVQRTPTGLRWTALDERLPWPPTADSVVRSVATAAQTSAAAQPGAVSPGPVSAGPVSAADDSAGARRDALAAVADPWADPSGQRTLRIAGLPPGTYRLLIDRQVVATADASDWAAGVALRAGPEFTQLESLRRTLIEKNRLYFYRWRPQNETYLFGFRKHEQGNNAAEIPAFDPLVARQESIAAERSQPVEHYYELTRVAGPDNDSSSP
jgi:lysophospholipase L1-like esterase